MPRIEPFETHTARYESWFERHEAAYRSELLALRALVPIEGRGLEVGVGTGRFAAPLGIATGVDPSSAMLAYARDRGIQAVRAVAERLPFADRSFDHALIVTTICFVDDPARMLAELCRVLRPQGALVIGFIDRDTPLGRHYLEHKDENVFYRDARFFSADEVERLLGTGKFADLTWAQTLFGPVDGTGGVEAARPGRGEGAFVVVRAHRHD